MPGFLSLGSSTGEDTVGSRDRFEEAHALNFKSWRSWGLGGHVKVGLRTPLV